jgi:thiamine transporter ThiT
MKNLLFRNYTIFWKSIVRFQNKAIGTSATFNIQVYIHTTVQGDVLRYDDHVIRGVLLCYFYTMSTRAISLVGVSNLVTLGITCKSR